MQVAVEFFRYTYVLILAAVVDLSLQAAIKGGSNNVGPSLKSQSPMSVEHELQALVDTGMLSSAEQSTVNYSPPSVRSNGGHSINPADLARAATLVDAQLKAQGQAQSQNTRELPAVPKAEAAKVDDMLIAEPEKPEDPLASLDLTPHAVAEYLLITGDFHGFEQAIGDLLSSNVISPVEASQYKDAVGWEYETLLYKLVNVKAASLQEFMEADQLSTKSNSINRGRSKTVVSKPGKAAAMLPPHKVAAPGVNLHNKLRQLQMRALVEKEETLDELLNVINQNSVENNNPDPFAGDNFASKKSADTAIPDPAEQKAVAAGPDGAKPLAN